MYFSSNDKTVPINCLNHFPTKTPFHDPTHLVLAELCDLVNDTNDELLLESEVLEADTLRAVQHKQELHWTTLALWAGAKSNNEAEPVTNGRRAADGIETREQRG